MAITKVGEIGAVNGGSGATIVLTVGAGGVGAHHSVIISVQARTATLTGWSAVDSKGNSYAVEGGPVYAGSQALSVATISAHNITALVSGDTITVTVPSNLLNNAAASEYDPGAGNKLQLDQVRSNPGSGPTDPTSGTVLTSTSFELLIGTIGFSNLDNTAEVFTPGGGWTANIAAQGNFSATQQMGVFPEYQLVTTISSYAADGSFGHDAADDVWIAIITTYQAIALATTFTRTIPQVAALLKVGLTRTIPQAAALAKTLTRTVPQTAVLAQTFSRTVPQAAVLFQAGSVRVVPQSAALLKVGLIRTIPQTAVLSQNFTRVIPQHAVLFGTTRIVPATMNTVAYTVSSWTPGEEVDVGAFDLAAGALPVAITFTQLSSSGLILRGMSAEFDMISGMTAALRVTASGAGALAIGATIGGDGENAVLATGALLAPAFAFSGTGQVTGVSTATLPGQFNFFGDCEVFHSDNPSFYRFLEGLEMLVDWGLAGAGSVIVAGTVETVDPAADCTVTLHHAIHLETEDDVAFCGKTVLGHDELDPTGLLSSGDSVTLLVLMTPDVVDITVDLVTGKYDLRPLELFSGDDAVVLRVHLLQDGIRISTIGASVKCIISESGNAQSVFQPSQEACSVYDADNGVMDYQLPGPIESAGQYLVQFSVMDIDGRTVNATPIPFTVGQGI